VHIVLVEPEIPGNTGNIARLCAGTGIELHLVRPLGFSTDDKYLKRAGLDYWHLVTVHYHDRFDEVLEMYPNRTFYFCSTKASRTHCDVAYPPDAVLVFGKESAGLPHDLLAAHRDRTIRIPMASGVRSLNLSNAVAVVAYEALRQNNFSVLQCVGIGFSAEP
jgi:RNA methyltransferase, trmH family, group 2